MVFIKTWNEAKPAGSDPALKGDDEIRDFKYAIRERLAEDHAFYDDESGHSDVGYHKKATFLNQGSDPSLLANALILFSKIAGGKSELHSVHEDGNLIQLTRLGKLLISALDIESSARGDIIVRGASDFGRVAKGTDAQVLGGDGTDTIWKSLFNLSSLLALHGARLKSAGGFNTDLSVTDPTANRTITLPDANINLTGYLEIKVGGYTGDGVDNRDITIGFNDVTKVAKFVLVLVKRTVSEGAIGGGHWMFFGDEYGQAPTDGSYQSAGLKSFGANSFRVGTNAEANQNGRQFNFIAIG